MTEKLFLLVFGQTFLCLLDNAYFFINIIFYFFQDRVKLAHEGCQVDGAVFINIFLLNGLSDLSDEFLFFDLFSLNVIQKGLFSLLLHKDDGLSLPQASFSLRDEVFQGADSLLKVLHLDVLLFLILLCVDQKLLNYDLQKETEIDLIILYELNQIHPDGLLDEFVSLLDLFPEFLGLLDVVPQALV